LDSVDSVEAMLASLLDAMNNNSNSDDDDYNKNHHKKNKLLIVVGATNRIDSIPPIL
jgi:SpoVK/Ycf46/Vps4 family AAA+-type ATPase